MKHTVLFFLLAPLIVFGQQYQLEQAFPKLPSFLRAIDLQYFPDGSNRLAVVQQLGLVYIFENNSNTSSKKIFLDMQSRVSQGGGETGLLGLAFHPNYAQNGFIYVNYTDTGKLTSFVSRLQATGANLDTVLRSTEKILLQIDQPAPNHNGGWIGFGPDGYLYTSFGDGGSFGDPWGNAQSKDTLLGKILRIDVDHGDPYAIPSSNPFASGGGRPEIYAYGLRNAWKCSFDPVSKKLWAGDVGQNNYEEVDTIISGGNYGWDKKEGYHCYPTNITNCDSTGFQSPVWEYSHGVGFSITGGYVYRGLAVPSLMGKYIYADFNGKIFALDYEGLATAQNAQISSISPRNIATFGIDQNSELYVVSYGDTSSRIYKFTPEASVEPENASSPVVSIYPNPSSNTLHLELAESTAFDYMISNASGQVVKQGRIDFGDRHRTIDISLIPSGAYTIQVNTPKGSSTKKFVVEK